jgi:geranylgeranyl diphosphate synthase type II
MRWDELKPPIYKKWKMHWFATHPQDIANYSWDYLFTGGKEIRAKLFCELWKHLSPDLEIDAEFAFMIECIHVASLILDDMPLMDNAEWRREKQTLHRHYSDKKALLLFYDVMNMVQTIWVSKCPSFLSRQTWLEFMKGKLQKLLIGQWFDLCKKGTLYELASFKTGVLFEFVSELVALLIQLDAPFWREWGNRLGILFQWMDDWKDQEEDSMNGSRNAFNESYESTLYAYGVLWRQIEEGIGSSWFCTPFGQYLKEYFTANIPLHSMETSMTTLYDRIHQFEQPLIRSLSISPEHGVSLSMKILEQKRQTIEYDEKEYDKIKEIGWEVLDQLLETSDSLPLSSSSSSFHPLLSSNAWIHMVYQKKEWETYLPEMKEWMDRRIESEEDLQKLIQSLIHLSEQMDPIQPLPIDLWHIPESEWMDRPELKQYALECFQKNNK